MTIYFITVCNSAENADLSWNKNAIAKFRHSFSCQCTLCQQLQTSLCHESSLALKPKTKAENNKQYYVNVIIQQEYEAGKAKQKQGKRSTKTKTLTLQELINISTKNETYHFNTKINTDLKGLKQKTS